MINDYNPSMGFLLSRAKFKRPMSKRARKLLEAMAEWSKQFHGLWGGAPKFLDWFEQAYDPILYEDICHQYRIEAHLKQLGGNRKKDLISTVARASLEDVQRAMQLGHFSDSEWLKEQKDLLDNNRRVKSLDTPQSREVYNWLVDHFLVTDFTEEDINKITFLSDEKVNLDLVKKTALKIKGEDVHKCSMAYLYAIVRDIREKNEYISRHTKDVNDRNTQKLVQALQFEAEAKNKLVHKFDEDMKSQWERERELLEVARDLKKNE